MGFLHNLKLRFSPPSMNDPDFGRLLFMFVPVAPHRSYWEGEWTFPSTGRPIGIGLLGSESGPIPEARQFYLSLPERFEKILAAARPKLEEVFKIWLRQELPNDIFTVVELSGFDVDNPRTCPQEWSVSFETKGEKWLGIVIPFIGEEPHEAVVDT